MVLLAFVWISVLRAIATAGERTLRFSHVLECLTGKLSAVFDAQFTLLLC